MPREMNELQIYFLQRFNDVYTTKVQWCLHRVIGEAVEGVRLHPAVDEARRV